MSLLSVPCRQPWHLSLRVRCHTGKLANDALNMGSAIAQLSTEVPHENEGVTVGDLFKLVLQVSIECISGRFQF